MNSFNETYQQSLDRIVRYNAKTKGDLLGVSAKYLEKIGKKESIPLIEKRMADFGYPFNLNNVSIMSWYPVEAEMALFFSLIEVLGWDEKNIKEFGKNFTKLSFLERIMARYFITTKKTYAEASNIWRRHMDTGHLETPEYNETGKYCILRLKGLDLHPLYCIFLAGMFETMATYITKAKKNSCVESKCIFKSEPYHEFIVRWE